MKKTEKMIPARPQQNVLGNVFDPNVNKTQGKSMFSSINVFEPQGSKTLGKSMCSSPMGTKHMENQCFLNTNLAQHKENRCFLSPNLEKHMENHCLWSPNLENHMGNHCF